MTQTTLDLIRRLPAPGRSMRGKATCGRKMHGGPTCGRSMSDTAMSGMSMFIVLVALTLLSVAAVGLVRLVDTGALVAGNLSLKQATTLAADRAADQTVESLASQAHSAGLDADIVAQGYYASMPERVDVTGTLADIGKTVIDWNGDNCGHSNGSFGSCIKPSVLALATSTAGPVAAGINAASTIEGIRTKVLVMRMCKTSGSPTSAGNECVVPVRKNADTTRYRGVQGSYAPGQGGPTDYGPYYRILVRAEGPRKTLSYTETTVHFPQVKS
jgi:type IV pilus assembly protein PilX